MNSQDNPTLEAIANRISAMHALKRAKAKAQIVPQNLRKPFAWLPVRCIGGTVWLGRYWIYELASGTVQKQTLEQMALKRQMGVIAK